MFARQRHHKLPRSSSPTHELERYGSATPLRDSRTRSAEIRSGARVQITGEIVGSNKGSHVDPVYRAAPDAVVSSTSHLDDDCPVATSTHSSADAPHLANPDLNPSFTKGVFLGEIREDLVFPFPALDAEEHEALRLILDSFRAFAATRL